MKFYNTLTRQVEEFKPHYEGKVSFYTCGPTVYHYAHIGNMRNYVGHDILDKTLRYIGYDVKRIMNITDVGHLKSDSDTGEDKMVSSAKREHKTVLDVAKFYTDAFFKDFEALNCRIPDIVSPATDNIDEYIKIISSLLEKGYAYQAGGNVYFDVSKLSDYYQLTNHKEDEMVVGVREGVEFDESKRNQADFALWFTKSKFEDQELKWDSPFGVGYPGWHIECSGISIKYIGEYLDIHGGGVDNIFPHHTNEIAQSEAYLGHKWCNYWFHNEHLMDETGKMSKSHGAILSVEELIKRGYNPLSFRFMCLNSHYRKQLVFSFDSLNSAEQAYLKLKNKISLIKDEGELSEGDFDKYKNMFIEYITNDLNTANAITLLYDLLKDDTVNGHTKIELVRSFDKVLSLDLLPEVKEVRSDHEHIMKLIETRNEAKKAKNFELADAIRDELLSKGIALVDTREGTIYKEV
ncbi:cysteine--tRNA ligase [bacterium]|nr:cysteine--tRNA ligase [bacterium]MDY3756875.1 cysteine--tRNA ligase [Bacilli bacterium]